MPLVHSKYVVFAEGCEAGRDIGGLFATSFEQAAKVCAIPICCLYIVCANALSLPSEVDMLNFFDTSFLNSSFNQVPANTSSASTPVSMRGPSLVSPRMVSRSNNVSFAAGSKRFSLPTSTTPPVMVTTDNDEAQVNRFLYLFPRHSSITEKVSACGPSDVFRSVRRPSLGPG